MKVKLRRTTGTLLFALAAVVLVAALATLGAIWFSYHQGQQKYAELAEYADAGSGAESEIVVDWDALRAINPDVVAWLLIPGTNVNYPIVKGADNEYYLSHDFGGEAGWLAQYGAVFMDWRNNPDWSDESYFMYGHHMIDGSMFAGIADMADQARFDACRTILLASPDGNFRLRSYSLVHCSDDDPIVETGFASGDAMTAYIQDKIERSVVDVGEIPAASEITKSFAFATCDNVSTGRYVLYAYVEEKMN